MSDYGEGEVVHMGLDMCAVDFNKKKEMRMDIPALKKLNKYISEFNINEIEKKELEQKIVSILQNEGIVIPYMDALITSRCTLRCRDCNNLMPYCKSGKNLSEQTVIQDVNRICNAIDCCVCMCITGGEPFLHEDLGEIINYVANNDKILFVEVITNGTLLPSPSVIRSMKNKKVIVKISKYEKYSKISAITDILSQEGVRFLVSDNLQWITSGGIERRNKDREKIISEYLSCGPGKHCKSLWNGKLYACARAAFLHDIGASDHPSDYLEVAGEKLRQRLLHFYLADYVDACDFCDHKSDVAVRVQPAIQCE